MQSGCSGIDSVQVLHVTRRLNMATGIRPAIHKPLHLPHLPVRTPRQHELVSGGNYRVLVAETEEERSAVFRLRFQVFNLELHEGLDSAYETGEDRDKFDDICKLLYVQ